MAGIYDEYTSMTPGSIVDDFLPGGSEGGGGLNSAVMSSLGFIPYIGPTMSALTGFINLARGASGKVEKIDPSRYMIKDRIELPRYDVRPELRDARTNASNLAASRNLTAPQAIAGQVALQDYVGEARTRAGQINADIAAKEQLQNQNIDRYNNQMRYNIVQGNIANRAAAENMKSEGIGQIGIAGKELGQNLLNVDATNKMTESNLAMAKAVEEAERMSTENFNTFMDEFQAGNKELIGGINEAIDNIGIVPVDFGGEETGVPPVEKMGMRTSAGVVAKEIPEINAKDFGVEAILGKGDYVKEASKDVAGGVAPYYKKLDPKTIEEESKFYDAALKHLQDEIVKSNEVWSIGSSRDPDNAKTMVEERNNDLLQKLDRLRSEDPAALIRLYKKFTNPDTAPSPSHLMRKNDYLERILAPVKRRFYKD